MFHLIIKDIKNIIYDKKSLMFILVMPIVLMSILGMALQGVFSEDAGSGISSANIAIVKAYDLEKDMEKVRNYLGQPTFGEVDFDLEAVDVEAIFFEEFLGSEEISEFISYKVVSSEEAYAMMDDDDISAIVVLPEGFIYDSYINFLSPTRNKIHIEIIKNTNRGFTAGIVEEIMRGYGDMMNNQYAQLNTMIKILVNNNIIDTVDERIFEIDNESGLSDITIETKSIEGGSVVNSFQYYAVAIMAMFILYAASFGAISLYEERKQFSLQRLEVSGKNMYALLGSNFFRVYGIVVLQSLAMIAYSTIVLKVSWGSVPVIILTIVFSAFAVSGIGTFVATLTLTYDNVNIANIFQFAFIQVMALLGGSFIPIEVLPESIQKLSIISVNSSIVSMYLNGMVYGNIGYNYKDIIYLVVFGLSFMLLSGIVLRISKKEVIA